MNNSTPLTFMNTSMHGVSDPFVTRAFELFGFSTSSLKRVEEQRFPDPEFPTVPFPNPEEKGEHGEKL
jgi:phosphomannomutase